MKTVNGSKGLINANISQPQQSQQQQKGFYYFDINSTTNCNLRCTYCIEHDWFKKPEKTPDKPLIENIKTKVSAMLKSEKFLDVYSGIGLFFWGGESTLNPGLIQDLVNYFDNDDRVAFFLYSNGFNIKPVLPLLQKYKHRKAANGMAKVVIQVSYDGAASHDIARVDVAGKGTASRVLANIKLLKKENIPHSIKPTLAYEDLDKISGNYYDYKKLADEPVQSAGSILYGPTIDYLSDHHFTKEQMDGYLQDLKKQIKIILKDEIAYYKKHGKFFFNWLNPSKAICGAGAGLSIIDTNGDILVCHGALYEDNRDEHKITSINKETEEFIDDILNARTKYFEAAHKLPPECVTCHAHHCMKCNVKKASISKKDTYFERWADYHNQDHICKLYKYLGSLRIAILKVIEDTK